MKCTSRQTHLFRGHAVDVLLCNDHLSGFGVVVLRSVVTDIVDDFVDNLLFRIVVIVDDLVDNLLFRIVVIVVMAVFAVPNVEFNIVKILACLPPGLHTHSNW